MFKVKIFLNYLSRMTNLSKKRIYITVNGEHPRNNKEKT